MENKNNDINFKKIKQEKFETPKETDFTNLLDGFISLYQSLQKILLISLNDMFFKENLEILLNEKLVLDTIKILKEHNYNLDKLLSPKIYDIENFQDNLFTYYSKIMFDLLSNPLIIQHEHNPSTTNKRIKQSFKKSYEVDVLSNYLVNILESENLKCILEMGCGKSYLTDDIMISDDMLYIGVDRKDDLIDKTSKVLNSTGKENSYVLNYNVTVSNFGELYGSEIQSIFNKKSENNQIYDKILLFGLHSCGNLTSDTIKLFTQYDCFSHIVIVGCCLNLLKEYVSKEAVETEEFKYYIKNIGYDNKGNFLEQTLLYDYKFEDIGYPMSQYIIFNYPKLFLSRTVRNSSMQSLPKNEDKIFDSKNNIFYKKSLYRTMLQAFFEIFFPSLKNYYGFGKVKLEIKDDFNVYLGQIFNNLINKSNIQGKEELISLKEKLNKDSCIVDQFYNDFLQYEDLLWAFYTIRLKFSRIVEYIIALDRIIYMKEKGVNKIELIKIFDENCSVRNLLIYASK
jgi:hypothetical protein